MFEYIASLLGSHSAYYHIENSKKPYSKATSSILIDPEFYKLLSSQNLFFPLHIYLYMSHNWSSKAYIWEVFEQQLCHVDLLYLSMFVWVQALDTGKCSIISINHVLVC